MICDIDKYICIHNITRNIDDEQEKKIIIAYLSYHTQLRFLNNLNTIELNLIKLVLKISTSQSKELYILDNLDSADDCFKLVLARG